MRHVMRALHQLSADESCYRLKLVRDSDIYDANVDSGMPSQDVYPSSTSQKIHDHLRGDIAGIGAYALVYDTMIGRKGKHDASWNGRLPFARHGAVLNGQFFEPPQACLRFRQSIQPPLCIDRNCVVHISN